MANVLIIGAGGVGHVVAHKCAQHRDLFHTICLASRTIEKCRAIAKGIGGPLQIEAVDADRSDAVSALIRRCDADVLINVATPYQNLAVMEACVQTGIHYVDTSLDDERDWVKYDYSDQWAFLPRFQKAGTTGVLSIGFDPGVVNVYCAWAQKHLFDQIDTIDMIDCNAGNTNRKFATNFDPETNLREILADVIAYEDGAFRTSPALETRRTFDFPGIGARETYLMTHEEVLTVARFIPGVRNVRFWMAFNDEYLRHLRVLRDIGMTSIEPVLHEGHPVVPIKFLKCLLPNPADLASESQGITCIGCLIEGHKDDRPRKVFVYNNCRHEDCFREVGSQAISYTTGAPAVLAARLVLSGAWSEPGVYNPEQLDPDPFMEEIGNMGLPWKVNEL